MRSNSVRVGRGLYLLKIGLDSFVPQEFLNFHGVAAAAALQQILGQVRDEQRPFANMKAQDLLAVMQAAWSEVFHNALAGIEPNLVHEVIATHETWASRQSFSTDAAYQALSALQVLLSAMASPSAAELEKLKLECLESTGDDDSMGPLESPAGVVLLELSAPPAKADPVNPAEAVEALAATDPYLAELIRGLRESGALLEQDRVAQATRERIEPVYADAPVSLEFSSTLAQALEDLGIDRLYDHQAEAIEKSLAGSNVVLEASTASGKTWAFTVAMAQSLLQNPGGYALLICSTKAIAQARLVQLNDLLPQVGLNAESYDGDISEEQQRRIRETPPSILLTTPETLNTSLLGCHGDWLSFLKNLKFVGIDDMHEYGGYFGSNMAVLLRRFAHYLELIGAAPRYFLAAACANPAEHAENLTGQAFELVSIPDQRAPKLRYLSVDPDIPDLQFQAKFRERIRDAALAGVKMDKSVIIFCPTRKFAQQCYDSARQECAERGLNENCIGLSGLGLNDDLQDAGPAEMPDGAVKVIFSTNALETGMNLGRTEGVIFAGFPDTVRLALQRIGPAGPDWDQDAFVLCYAMNDPINRFYTHNLPAFRDQRADEIVANSANLEIVRTHLPSLIQESAGRIYSFSADVLGDAMFQELSRHREAEPDTDFPQGKVGLRGSEGQLWSLVCDNESVGTISAYRKFREAYERAVCLWSGIKYRVERVEETGGDNANDLPQIHLIEIESEDLENFRTVPYFERTLEIREEHRCLKWTDGISIFLGNVTRVEKLTSVKVVDESAVPETEKAQSTDMDEAQVGGREIDVYQPSGNPTWEATSQAFWIDVAGIINNGSRDPVADAEVLAGAPDPGLAALEQMLRVGTLLTFPTDFWDTTTDVTGDKIFLIENYPGGIGLVKKAFDRWRDLLAVAVGIAKDCACSKGCASCLITPHFYGQTLDKIRGIELAQRLLEATEGSPAENIWPELSR